MRVYIIFYSLRSASLPCVCDHPSGRSLICCPSGGQFFGYIFLFFSNGVSRWASEDKTHYRPIYYTISQRYYTRQHNMCSSSTLNDNRTALLFSIHRPLLGIGLVTFIQRSNQHYHHSSKQRNVYRPVGRDDINKLNIYQFD